MQVSPHTTPEEGSVPTTSSNGVHLPPLSSPKTDALLSGESSAKDVSAAPIHTPSPPRSADDVRKKKKKVRESAGRGVEEESGLPRRAESAKEPASAPLKLPPISSLPKETAVVPLITTAAEAVAGASAEESLLKVSADGEENFEEEAEEQEEEEEVEEEEDEEDPVTELVDVASDYSSSCDEEDSELKNLKRLLATQAARLEERLQAQDTNDVNVDALLQEELPHMQPDASVLSHLCFDGSVMACTGVRTGARYAPSDDEEEVEARKLSHTAKLAVEDDETLAMEKEMEARTARMDRRGKQLRDQWAHPPVSHGVIPPAPPPVHSATTEAEIQERALAADDFAKSQIRLRRESDRRRSTKQKVPSEDHSAAASEQGSPSASSAEGDDEDALVNTMRYSQVREPRELSEMSMASLALGRVSMASCSVAKVTDSTLAVLEMLANRPDVVLPSPSETVVVRKGDVLSSKHILKLDLQEALRARMGSTGMIAGAPFFRIVPKLNIAGVAQVNASAVYTIINELQRAHVEGPIIWVNLREEPLVYINNTSYIVRERDDPMKPVIIPKVTGKGIEVIEGKLKQEVLQEAYGNGGNISVQVESRGDVLEDQWECANMGNVQTVAEVFRRISREEIGGNVQYFRRPITLNVGPQPEDFDFVLEACLEEPKAVFIFNCQSGRGRTSSMMQIASIVRFYQLCVKDVAADVRVLRGNVQGPSYRTIQKLVSLFPDGKLHERRLMILMDMADKVYSMADHINEAFSGMDDAPEVAKMRLQLYAYFLVFSYYCEQRLWNYTTKATFKQWLEENSEVMLLIRSVRDKLDDQLKAERVVAPSVQGPEAEALRAIRQRRGNVLSAGRILCCKPMDYNSTDVLALRQLAPDVPIFTCGRVGEVARADLLREIKEAFPQHRSIHWLSLRAEPMVLINDEAYTLTEYNAPVELAETGTTMHVSLQAMEQVEDRLRRDVLLEAQDNQGFIVLHRLTEDGVRVAEKVKVISVRTTKSTMEEFGEMGGASYYRVPMPFAGQLLASDIDPLVRYLKEAHIGKDDVVVINDSEGTTRTTVALNILTLFRAAQLSDLRTVQTTQNFTDLLRNGETGKLLPRAQMASMMDVEADEVPQHHVELLIASTICQMMMAGSLLRTVDAAIALGGRGRRWNILHQLDALKKRIGVVGHNKPQSIADALHGLRCYILVLLSCVYLDDPAGFGTGAKFSQWVTDHAEVFNVIESLEHRGEAALKYVAADNLMKADVSRRRGDVLTANFCVKADHFPGCQKKGLQPSICGAPNFRKVNYVNVYGVAIPTILGIHNVLSLLGASSEAMQTYPGQSNDAELFLGFAAPRLFDPSFHAEEIQHPLRGSVVWVNLREEPLLYVGDRPFVFRDLAAPYVNVELTGIQTEQIELVEYELKRDVLNEAEEYEGKFLVHDEGNPGELVGVWETANESTVKTLREVYEELVVKGFRCEMLRLPVTDEQSPEIRDFDLLVNALLPRIAKHLDRRETLSFVFNCQMGRGRTTTGMVICCLLIGLVIPEYYNELHTACKDTLYPAGASDLSNGEYEAIVQLKRVLTQGRVAKHRVDLVLEACSKMQNLRTAIESFAIAVSSPDITEEGRARAHHAGVHYLKRYFNLIVFAVYLEEGYDHMQKKMGVSFVEWMNWHPEITSLFETCALK